MGWLVFAALLFSLPLSLADFGLGQGPFVLVPSSNTDSFVDCGSDNGCSVERISVDFGSSDRNWQWYLQPLTADSGPDAYALYQVAGGTNLFLNWDGVNTDDGPSSELSGAYIAEATDGVYAWQVYTLDVLDDNIGVQLYNRFLGQYLDTDGTDQGNGYHMLRMEGNGDTSQHPGELFYFYAYQETSTSTTVTTEYSTSTYTSDPGASTTTETATVTSCLGKRDEHYALPQRHNRKRQTTSDNTFYGTGTDVSTSTETSTTTITITGSGSLVTETSTYTENSCSSTSTPDTIPTSTPGSVTPITTPPLINAPTSSDTNVPQPTGGGSATAQGENAQGENVQGPTATPAPDHWYKTRTGIIAGTVVGGVVLLSLVAGTIFYLKRRKRRQRREEMVREISTIHINHEGK